MRAPIDASTYILYIERKKAELGISDSDIEKTRNKGNRRSFLKEKLLEYMEERALKLGLEPIVANYRKDTKDETSAQKSNDEIAFKT